MSSAELQGQLTLARADLTQALRTVAKAMGRAAPAATIRFESEWLVVSAGQVMAKAPAKGDWPPTIMVRSTWVRRMAKALPPGDPVSLRVKSRRLYVNSYSELCQASDDEEPITPLLTEAAKDRRISEAAAILKRLLISKDDLAALVERTRDRGPARWRPDEARMISAVSQAWALLAPLGVETSDLRTLIDGAVRDAWKAKKA